MEKKKKKKKKKKKEGEEEEGGGGDEKVVKEEGVKAETEGNMASTYQQAAQSLYHWGQSWTGPPAQINNDVYTECKQTLVHEYS